jgi:hypothetical protein
MRQMKVMFLNTHLEASWRWQEFGGSKCNYKFMEVIQVWSYQGLNNMSLLIIQEKKHILNTVKEELIRLLHIGAKINSPLVRVILSTAVFPE